jgi:hypothetical protein
MKAMAELGGILNHYISEYINQNIRCFSPFNEIKNSEIFRAKREYSEWQKENELMASKESQFAIYQVKYGNETRNFRYVSLEELEALSLPVSKTNYSLIYAAPLSKLSQLVSETVSDAPNSEQGAFRAEADNHYPTLNKIYELFNRDGQRPPNYSGRSVSMSDVIVLQHGGEVSSYYVDDFGFKELPAFIGVERNLPHREDNDFLHGSGNRLAIYQISKDADNALDYALASLDKRAAQGLDVERKNYKFVYQTPFSERIEFLTDRNALLNETYQKFNYNRPEDYNGRSVSTSDVIVLKYNGDFAAFYVDDTGFVEIDGFLSQEKAVLPPSKEQFATPGNPAAETAAKDTGNAPASFSWDAISEAVDAIQQQAPDPAKAPELAKAASKTAPDVPEQ